MSSRRLEDVLEDEKLLRWWRVEDVFKTGLEDQQMFGGLLFKKKITTSSSVSQWISPGSCLSVCEVDGRGREELKR